jgi:predicted RNA-binding Zn ribbon-like protein
MMVTMSHTSSGLACLDFVHRQLEEEPTDSPAARAAVDRFRTILGRLLTDEARGRGARDDDLEAFDRLLARAAAHRGLVSTVRGYGWGWRTAPDRLVEQLFAPAWSAATLLTSTDRHRLKCCDGCDRLFLDQSRNRSRRWCDMGECGNRDKVRRFRSRSQPRRTARRTRGSA